MKGIDKNNIYDEYLYRQVKLMSTIGPSALPPDQLDRVSTSSNLICKTVIQFSFLISTIVL